MFVEPARFKTSPELICWVVDVLSFIVKAVVTAEFTSLIAATIAVLFVVFKLDKGQLQRQGTFEELLNLNEQFEDSAKKI